MKKVSNGSRLDFIISDDMSVYKDLYEQLKIYKECEENDCQEMLWNNINLNDPESIVQYLFRKSVEEKHLTDFMHTLISLCTIDERQLHTHTHCDKL